MPLAPCRPSPRPSPKPGRGRSARRLVEIKGTAAGDEFKVTIDIRSVNNRNLDIHWRAPQELAALTCKRATNGELKTNLLPPEYTARYKQRFNERLIMSSMVESVCCT